MAKDVEQIKLETDVLVVGGGLAGNNGAIGALEKVTNHLNHTVGSMITSWSL